MKWQHVAKTKSEMSITMKFFKEHPTLKQRNYPASFFYLGLE